MDDFYIDDVESQRKQRNKAIMQLVYDGQKYSDIAKLFGLSSASISKIALQEGFSKKPHLLMRSNWPH